MPVRAERRAARSASGRSTTACRARQIDRDGGALAERARDLHGAAGLMREAIDLRQPEAGALADRLGGEERIEHLGDDVRRDADAGVAAPLMATYSPAPTGSPAPSVDVLRRVMVTVPPSGMASRALMTRLTSAISNSLMSTVIGQASGGEVDDQADVAAEPARQHLADRVDALARCRSAAD